VIRIAVLADDLIWQTRLADAVSIAGAAPIPIRSLEALAERLDDIDAAIVDLAASRYDPILAIERVAERGRRVLAVGQHDDHVLRKRALDAGAERVLAYRKLYEDGPATLTAWLARQPRSAAAR
jgi:DNA-binding NarL/FixJ family response regulator